MKTSIHFWLYLAEVFLEWEIFQIKVVDKIKTHILYSITLFRKKCFLWRNVEKYFRAEWATDDNMAHAHFMLDTKGYKYTLTICNTHCFPTVTVIARTHLIDAFIRKLRVLLKLSAVWWKIRLCNEAHALYLSDSVTS